MYDSSNNSSMSLQRSAVGTDKAQSLTLQAKIQLETQREYRYWNKKKEKKEEKKRVLPFHSGMSKQLRDKAGDVQQQIPGTSKTSEITPTPLLPQVKNPCEQIYGASD